MADARARVDAVLATWGNGFLDHAQQAVRAAIGYSLLGAGKRLRPTLVFACHDAVGGVGSVAELAAAVEVVHAYSLVHDDLPCMDNDDLRRGRPTTHRAFDVPTATRAGFLMVPLAAAVLAHGFEELNLTPERQQEIALELFRAAGAGGMIGGQTLDLEAEGIDVSIERLAEIHERKTGALIAAACVIGGAAGGAAPGVAQALRGYGADIGLAFQIYDDVLDATATSDALGKTAGKDAARAKSTFVARLGVAAARREAERLTGRAVGQLQAGGVSSEVLTELAHYIVTRPN
jgi:geranylgeranyl pyrophosphate synthase